MDKQGVIYYFTKDEVEYIRNQIALKFDWTDKVMNKLDDFLTTLHPLKIATCKLLEKSIFITINKN